MANKINIDAPSFRRAQLEWALWRVIRQGRPAPEDIPSAFRTRIKKLLDYDRAQRGALPGSEPDAADFAFSEPEHAGSPGNDAGFSVLDAACACYALDMVDAGFKPSECVFLLRHIRERLRGILRRMFAAETQPDRQRIKPSDAPSLPTYIDKKGNEWADARIFLIIKKIDISEVLASQVDHPLFVDPKVIHGAEALTAEFLRFSEDYRKAFVLEIAWSASLVAAFLEKAPLITRGRKS